eukprot:1153744-Pelagomonas_calceolata.AAC.3
MIRAALVAHASHTASFVAEDRRPTSDCISHLQSSISGTRILHRFRCGWGSGHGAHDGCRSHTR